MPSRSKTPTLANIKLNELPLKPEDLPVDRRYASFNPSLKISKADIRNGASNDDTAEVQQQFSR